MGAFQVLSEIPVRKDVNFDGTAGNGAIGVIQIFNLFGQVELLSLSAYSSVDLAGAGATIELGITGQTQLLLPTTLATDITHGKYWASATPAKGIAVPATCRNILLHSQSDPTPGIFATVAVADITQGSLSFVAIFRPHSVGASIIQA